MAFYKIKRVAKYVVYVQYNIACGNNLALNELFCLLSSQHSYVIERAPSSYEQKSCKQQRQQIVEYSKNLIKTNYAELMPGAMKTFL